MEHSRQNATVFERAGEQLSAGSWGKASWQKWRSVKGDKMWVDRVVREDGREGKLRNSTEAEKAEVPMSSQPPSAPIWEQKSVFLAVRHTGERSQARPLAFCYPWLPSWLPTSWYIPLTVLLLSSASRRDGATRSLDRKKTEESWSACPYGCRPRDEVCMSTHSGPGDEVRMSTWM